jgi:TolB-like protein/DNA-binding winged helix-turn-helix (wHTH) protein
MDDWRVDPGSGEISRNGATTRPEVRTMRVLLYLAERSGQVVSIEELLEKVWPDVAVSSDSVYQAVASLRRLLGDDPKQPTYIETVPRLGYRMVAPVRPWRDDAPSDPSGAPPDLQKKPGSVFRTALVWTAGAVTCLVLVAALLLRGRVASKDQPPLPATSTQAQKTIAVLPFLDLTPGMTEGEFADGMTEELIDKLSKVSGFRVPAPTASFYFKGKHIPVADIARNLGVVYVLDGSVRKSGGRVRIAARLLRADSSYVIWSETYDRSFSDILTVQDDIASEVTKALRTSIG